MMDHALFIDHRHQSRYVPIFLSFGNTLAESDSVLSSVIVASRDQSKADVIEIVRSFMRGIGGKSWQPKRFINVGSSTISSHPLPQITVEVIGCGFILQVTLMRQYFSTYGV